MTRIEGVPDLEADVGVTNIVFVPNRDHIISRTCTEGDSDDVGVLEEFTVDKVEEGG